MKNLEERLERLEEISATIRTDLPLEEAIALFEEGVKLAKGIEKELDKIEGRIDVLLNQPEKPEDKPELGLFDSLGE